MWFAKCDLEGGYDTVSWEVTKGTILKERNGILYWHGKAVCDVDSYMATTFCKQLKE